MPEPPAIRMLEPTCGARAYRDRGEDHVTASSALAIGGVLLNSMASAASSARARSLIRRAASPASDS